VETPLRLRKSVFDLKILLVEEIYREEIYIENQSSNTMKVQVHLPNDLKKILVFNPQFSFLGPNSFFKFPLKIIIPQNYQSKLKNYHDRTSEFPNQYKIMATFVGSKQTLHVPFEIIFRVSQKTLIMPNILDFGLVYKKTASKKTLSISNNTEVVHKILFDDTQDIVEILPKGAKIILTPGESREITCIFRALKVGRQEVSVPYRVIIQNRSVRRGQLLCRCEIFDCPLELSSLKVDFPRVQVNEMTSHSFTVTNTSQKEIKFQFIPPPFFISGLKIFPKCKQLMPYQTVNITVEFHAAFCSTMFKNSLLRNKLEIIKIKENEEEKILKVTQNMSKSKEDLLDFHLKDMNQSSNNLNKKSSFDLILEDISNEVSLEEEKQFMKDLLDFLNDSKSSLNLNHFFSVKETDTSISFDKIFEELKEVEDQISDLNNKQKELKESENTVERKKQKKQEKNEVEDPQNKLEVLDNKKIHIFSKFFDYFDFNKVNLF
jgi:hypothetical protein